MKVLLINGSPHEKGCTYTALMEVAATLEKEGIGADLFWVGNKPLSGCIACKSCVEKIKSTTSLLLRQVQTALCSVRLCIMRLQVARLLPSWIAHFMQTCLQGGSPFI